MRNLLSIGLFMFFFAASSYAQKGTAEPGFYPMGYSGDTWTGVVSSVDQDTREFTLIYTKGDKEQTFVAVLPKGFTLKTKDGKDREVKMTDLPGMHLRVYYMTKTRKDDNGVKVKTVEVFDIKVFPQGK